MRSLLKTTRAQMLIFLLATAAMPFCAWAQQGKALSFNLKEAQDYAVKNSYSVKNAALDLELAKKKIWETTAIGLPQINASVQYQDMLDVPTTLLPDFLTPAIVGVNEGLFGLHPTQEVPKTQYFAAKFGTQHNLSAGGTLSQLIFNGQYLIGLQASKTFHLFSEQNLQKSEKEVRENVTQSYFIVAVARESREILKKSLETMQQTLHEVGESFRSGFVEDITVDQMNLNVTNIRDAISTLDRQIEVSEKLLKFQMGIDLDQPVALTDSLPGLIGRIRLDPVLVREFKPENHIDYQLMGTQEKLQFLNLKKEQMTYLPVLSAYYTFQQRGMRDKFNFTDKHEPWYPTSIIGVNLDLPLFSSGMKHSRVEQAQIGLEKARITKQQVAQGLVLDAEQSRTGFNTSLEKFNRESDNLKLAENIYRKTTIKFKEGMASSTELTQAYTQYLSTQSSYYSAVFELLNAKNKLDKALNNY